LNHRKFRFISIISLLLLVGFSATSFVSYYVANESLADHIQHNTLPLTSDNIYSEIQRDLLSPIFISSVMAQDTFVRDWIINGEQDINQITRYLKSIQDRYQTITAFFISDKTFKYYHSTGLLKQVDPQEPQDDWYFRVRSLTDDFEINVDKDSANVNRTTVFVNHQVFDFDKNYIGAIGVGLSSETVKSMIEKYQSRYDRQVYFVDQRGEVMLHGDSFHGAMQIKNTTGLSQIAASVLSQLDGDFIYQRDGKTVYLNTRFVPEFNWYLLVEQVEKSEATIENTLWINLLLSLAITVVVLIIASITFNSYQKRLEEMATKDKLTSTASRHAFDPMFFQAVRSSIRRGEKVSAILADIDHFKQTNDHYGHLMGDRVLATVAQVMKANLRSEDVICRWGGEEFLILLSSSDLEETCKLAEKMRLAIQSTILPSKKGEVMVTVSFGVTLFIPGESKDEFFERADKALYLAKNKGRNRVEHI